MSALPSAYATWKAVTDRYEQVAEGDEIGVMARHVSYADLPGHVASHELDFAGGNVWGLSFFHVSDENPIDPAEFILLAIFGEELDVLVYYPGCFKVSQHRDEDAECDCGVMLCADPAEMDEMDAFGLFHQLGQPPLANISFGYIPW
ncbi:hypothetical protein [Stenotrophomonas maltophilia]|uniref:hypothetical protein n=1 Tax=Stenotrophomonas maltophilia TaxID=40324 RepID=UPI0021CACF34|nr:hypothetical protein [Stenotrophomonas maltophilia]MCU1144979.1 hypothetical protein [Stenotrophomonas maltophilia]